MKPRFGFLLLLPFLGTLSFSAPIWPNWKYDRQLTGRCPYIGPDEPDIAWVFDTGDTFKIRYASPVIGEDGTIYFSSPDSFVFAVGPNGNEKWRYKTKGIPFYSALDNQGRIYVGVIGQFGDSLWVLALDDSITYARLVWSWSIVHSWDYLLLPPLNIGIDGTIYITADSLRAIDNNGNLKWSYYRGVTAAYPPAISHDGSTLYCEGILDMWTTAFFSIDSSGATNWTRVTGPAPMNLAWASPAIGTDSAIYFITGLGILNAWLPNNSEKWPPVSGISDIVLYTSVSLGLNDTLWFINPGYRPIYRKFSPDDGSITFMDTILATPSQNNRYNSFIIDALGQAYIVVRDSGITQSTIYAFNSDGTVKWTYPIPEYTNRTTPAISPDRILYVIGGTKLYAIKDVHLITENSPDMVKPFTFSVFPNPFSEKLMIKFQASSLGTFRNTTFSIKIYDASGRLVKQFNHLTNYQSSIIWNGTDNFGRRLPSGIYFISAESEEFKMTKKAILVR